MGELKQDQRVNDFIVGTKVTRRQVLMWSGMLAVSYHT